MPEKKNTIGRFEILEKIGEGPIGAVYKALDPVIRRTVAIKVIKLYALEETTTFADVFEKIYRVVRTSTSLNHPNICVIYDLSEEKKIPYVTMEYIDGQDLDTALQKKRQFKRSELLSILQQVGDAIDFAHKKNVVHQDLKSTNILLTSDLHVKITDFGIAGLDEIAAAQTKKLLSIPFYISPEQALGEKVSSGSDLFSLGVIAYQLLSGELPFPGSSAASVLMMIARESQSTPKSLSQSRIPKERWDSFFGKALNKSPDQRFGSAKEMLDALTAMLPESDTDVYPFSSKAAPVTEAVSSAPTVLINASKILEESPKQTPAPFGGGADATIISRKVDQGDRTSAIGASAPASESTLEDDVSETISVTKEKVEEAKEAMMASSSPSESVDEYPKTELIQAPVLPKGQVEDAATIIAAMKPPETPVSTAKTTIIPPPTPAPDSKSSTTPASKAVITPPVIPTVPPSSATRSPKPTGDLRMPSKAEPSKVAPVAASQASVPIKKAAGPPNMKRYFVAAIAIAAFILLIGGLIFMLRSKPEEKQEDKQTPAQIVTPQPKPQPQTVEFVPTTGQISVTSDPVGATVFIGEVEQGITPMIIADLPFGKHTVKLQLKGYQDLQQEVEITAETSSLNVPVTLEKAVPQVGTLVIESTPPGAAIIINKKVVGVTPKTMTNMKASKYTVLLKLDGHEDYTGTVRVKTDETATLQASLVAVYKPPPPPEPEPVKPAEPKVTPGMLVQLGQPGVVPPKSIKKVPAKYPDVAKQRRLEGVVGLSILVSETGKVLEVKIVKSTNPILDDSAMEAVKQWTYQPATKDGVPVKVWLPVSMSFQRSR